MNDEKDQSPDIPKHALIEVVSENGFSMARGDKRSAI
jgi:hypothetical protein